MHGKNAALAAFFAIALCAAPALADGEIVISSDPPHALVSLEGHLIGPAPAVIQAPAGHYRIEVREPGYGSRSLSVPVLNGLTTRRHVGLVSVPEEGELRIASSPSGSVVLLDGRRVGRTPLLLRHLAPGRHHLTLMHDGYYDAGRTARVIAGLTSTASLELSAVPAALKPQPKPSARHVAAPERHTGRARSEAPRAHRAAEPAHHPLAHARLHPLGSAVHAQAPVTPAGPTPERTPPWDILGALFGLCGVAAIALGVRRSRCPDDYLPAHGPCGPLPWEQPEPPSPELRAAIAGADWGVAHTLLWRAIEAGAGDAWHYYHLGLAFAGAGRTPEAEAAYRTARQVDPECRAARFNLAVLLAEAGQPGLAVLAYRELLAAAPEDAAALFNLGHVYVGLGMIAEAITCWSEAQVLDPDDRAIGVNLRVLARRQRGGAIWPQGVVEA